MKFLIDEDCPYSLLEVFRKHGHEAVHVRDIMRSASDDKVFNHAAKAGLILVTRDLGFGAMFIKNKGFGLLLSRLPFYFKSGEIKGSFDKFLGSVDENIFPCSITVLEVGRYRIKRL